MARSESMLETSWGMSGTVVISTPGDSLDRRSSFALLRVGDLGQVLRQLRQLERGAVHLLRRRVGHGGQGRDLLAQKGRRDRVGLLQGAIGDVAAQRRTGFAQAAREIEGLVHRRGFRRHHQDEADLGPFEHGLDLARPAEKAAQYLADIEEERAEIVEELAAHELARAAEDHGAAHAQAFERKAAHAWIGAGEPLQGRAGDGIGQAFGGFQELERVGRGGRIEHDEVVLAVAAKLVERQGGSVLLRSGQVGGDMPIERVGKDMIAQLGIGHLLLDQVGERGGGIDTHGVQHVGRGDPQRSRGVGPDGGRRGAEIGHAQGIGQPGSGIDGTHQRAQARPGPNHPERGGGRGLAHAARSHTHQRLLGGEPLLHRLTRTTSAVTLSGAPVALAASTRA